MAPSNAQVRRISQPGGDQRPRQPDHIDRQIGRHLKRSRIARGWSQQTLASACGVSFQQVQKYERGANRITAARLFLLCDALDVPVGTFLMDALKRENGADAMLRAKLAGAASRLPADALHHLVALADMLDANGVGYREGIGGGKGADDRPSPAPQ